MRAKMRVDGVQKIDLDQKPVGLQLTFNAVGANSYPEDGVDENNSFARWTPSANLSMYIANPALLDSFQIGDEFYLDFTKAEQEH